ncbi:MAG: sulfotransferase [Betaproteobacteria bacterium]
MDRLKVSLVREAQGLLQAGRLVEALQRARQAVTGVRVCGVEHGLLAQVLLHLGQANEAEAVVVRALTLATGSADAYDALAFVSMALGAHERANALYGKATALAPQDPRLWHNRACSERNVGALAQAEAACDQAIRRDPLHVQSFLLRAELRVQTAECNHVDTLRAALAAQPNDYRSTVFLGYALGKELDDLGRFDEAFVAFDQASRTRRERLQYTVATDEAKAARIAAVYSAAFLQEPAAARTASDPAVDSSRFLFVVGLPRSGTTLVERILTGLPGVRSNGETDQFSQALLGAQRGTGDVFAQAAAADPHAVASAYARLASPGPAAERIIEKLPLNYLYLGAIRRALPQARILVVRRSPLDSCFAMYRTLFAAGYPFSYRLDELGRYYAAYDQLMRHWRAALGEGLIEVVYEELVREPYRVGRAMAEACGFSWQDQAIDIQANRAASLTASAAQVRRPIYGTSSGRWRHYRTHLQPLIASLQEAGIVLPD